jgi:hypothetical protein
MQGRVTIWKLSVQRQHSLQLDDDTVPANNDAVVQPINDPDPFGAKSNGARAGLSLMAGPSSPDVRA